MREAFLCDGIRTPIGRYGGTLSRVRPDDLAALVLRTLAERNAALDLEAVDDIILGCANQAGEDNRNVARMAGLLAGFPSSVPGTTINRLCGSGLDAVAFAARAIKAGDGDLYIAGGVESMSRAPFVVPKSEKAFAREAVMFDTTIGWRFVNPLFKRSYGVDSMPETAENVAADFNISRADQDAFALCSQRRAKAAAQSGRFSREIIPVEVRDSKGRVELFSIDEHPRSDTTLEGLADLATPFRENGSVTAGNSSGVNDGAAAIVIASEEAVKRYDLKPYARIVGAATAGVPPRIMGIGPAPATRKLLARTKTTINDIGVIELNEAFAAQALAVLRELGLPDDAEHVNPNGGAIALGHPLGMSGARLVLSAGIEMQIRVADLALCTMCVGVGQGIAALLARA